MLEFEIEADAFMRNMIRVLVGTMLEVGQRRRSPAQFVELLDGPPARRTPVSPRRRMGSSWSASATTAERVLAGTLSQNSRPDSEPNAN